MKAANADHCMLGRWRKVRSVWLPILIILLKCQKQMFLSAIHVYKADWTAVKCVVLSDWPYLVTSDNMAIFLYERVFVYVYTPVRMCLWIERLYVRKIYVDISVWSERLTEIKTERMNAYERNDRGRIFNTEVEYLLAYMAGFLS